MSWFYEPFIPYRIFETPNGNIQYQNFFMPNEVQIQQVMLPYQRFPSPSVGSPPPMVSQSPTPVMQQALGAAEMLRRPPTVTVTNANNNFTAANSYYYHHRPKEQHISNSSRGNVEKDAYKEMKRANQPQYAQGSAGGSKSRSGGVSSENGSDIEYRQVEMEWMVNRHHRGNREHTEMQQAEAVVHQHFEESLNLAQQQRLEAHYRNRAVPKSESDRENVLTNVNDRGNTGNHNNMISYAPYVNANHVYIPPSFSSVIVRNDSSYNNSSIPVPEAYLYIRTPTVLSVPAVKLESNKDPRQTNSMHYSRPLSSSVNTSQSIGYSSPEPHHPGPLLNTHGRYALYPPLTDGAQRELDTPPPAHLNAMMYSALPTFVPVAVPVDDLQTEALDLVMICNKATPETDVPLHLNSNYKNAKSYPQDTVNTLDISVRNNSKKRNYSEIDFPNNDNVSSSLTPLTSNLASDSAILSTTLSPNNSLVIPSSLSETISENESITISTANLTTVPTSIPSTVSMIDSKTVPTSNSKTTPFTGSTEISTNTSATAPITSSTTKSSTIVTTASSVTTSSNVPITNYTTYDSSPSTPPPVLMPATYKEMSSGKKTHHHKLKKAWLQRHVWTEDLKEAGVNIDQNSSHSFSQMDDTPPVLQCKIIKKRKISKSSSHDNIEVTSPPVILPSTSSSLYEPSTSSGTGTKRCRKRKISNPTTSSETRNTTDNDRPSETEKKVPPIKILTKRGRKPKIIVSIPLKKLKINDDKVRFFNIFKNQYNIATNKSLC